MATAEALNTYNLSTESPTSYTGSPGPNATAPSYSSEGSSSPLNDPESLPEPNPAKMPSLEISHIISQQLVEMIREDLLHTFTDGATHLYANLFPDDVAHKILSSIERFFYKNFCTFELGSLTLVLATLILHVIGALASFTSSLALMRSPASLSSSLTRSSTRSSSARFSPSLSSRSFFT